MPCLPLLSATSCSSQGPKGANRSSVMTVSLSRPLSAASPITAPSASPGLAPEGCPALQACCMAAAEVNNPTRSMPIKAAGAKPKGVNAEKRPPTVFSARKVIRKCFSFASFSRLVPGSVMATKALPVLRPTLASSRSQKKRNMASTSIVPPDLLATIYSVLPTGAHLAAALTCPGSVESRMMNLRPFSFRGFAAKMSRMTSGARDEPPIPNSMT